MNISKRLKTICDMIDEKSHVIDVGCDHAYLDIYLSKYKNCICIASDINKNALNNAINNINKYNLQDKITTQLANGINSINIKNDDIIVISGMGTNTIKKILKNKILPMQIIISSNNEIIELRKFMTSINYYVNDEKYIVDKNKSYIIIDFKKGNRKYKKVDYILGPVLKNDEEFLKFYKDKIEKILIEIPKKYLKKRIYYKLILKKIRDLI